MDYKLREVIQQRESKGCGLSLLNGADDLIILLGECIFISELIHIICTYLWHPVYITEHYLPASVTLIIAAE